MFLLKHYFIPFIYNQNYLQTIFVKQITSDRLKLVQKLCLDLKVE